MADLFPPPSLKKVAEEVAALLRKNNETVSVAETAAGGLISAALLSTPGASKFYKGGVSRCHSLIHFPCFVGITNDALADLPALYTLQSRIEFAGWVCINPFSDTALAHKISELVSKDLRRICPTNHGSQMLG
jgi:hypothetical protein